MSPEEAKRRKSIAYILRRRKRGRKMSANSGRDVKSWAEYSEVNFKPSGGYSVLGRISLLIVVPLMVMSSGLIIGFSRGAQDLVDRPVTLELWVLLAVLSFLLTLTLIAAGAYIALTLWRNIRSLRSHKNE